MRFPNPVTPAEAKAVWDSIPDPSSRKVAARLTQSGRPIHFSTIARWRSQGWREVTRAPHPLEAARAALDQAVPLLSGDAKSTAEDLVPPKVRGELEPLTDEKLLRAAARDVLIVQVALAREVRRQAETLVPKRPAELAALIQALGKSHDAVVGAFQQADAHHQVAVEGQPLRRLREPRSSPAGLAALQFVLDFLAAKAPRRFRPPGLPCAPSTQHFATESRPAMTGRLTLGVFQSQR